MRETESDPSRASGSRLGRWILLAVWVCLLAVAGIAVTEFALRQAPPSVSAKPVYDRLAAAYGPFAVQHIHPSYLFFFPLAPSERETINNEVCRVGPEGFRGPGPAEAGGRKLAFLLGGSAAFGHFASSDATSIPGFLNALQDEYFFVNAGVPSWNSNQELFLLVNEIAAHEPELIVAYDGSNDAAIAVDYDNLGLDFPPGTPESFDRLSELVDDIRAGGPRRRDPFWLRVTRRIAPRVAERLQQAMEPPPPPRRPAAAARLRTAADKHFENVQMMADVSRARGIHFVDVFQPILFLHDHHTVDLETFDPLYTVEDFRVFRERFSERAANAEFPVLDYANLFDARFDPVPVFDRHGEADLDAEAIFVDSVHLSDRGNRIVAETLLRDLEAELGDPPSPASP